MKPKGTLRTLAIAGSLLALGTLAWPQGVQQVPDLALKGLDGRTYQLHAMLGNGPIVLFFTSRYGMKLSLDDLEYLGEFAGESREPRVQLLVLSADLRTAEQLERVTQAPRIFESGGGAASELSVKSHPATILIGCDRRIALRIDGKFTGRGDLKAKLEQAIVAAVGACREGRSTSPGDGSPALDVGVSEVIPRLKVEAIALTGEQAPDLSPGVVFVNSGFREPMINASGVTAFVGEVRHKGTPFDGLWTGPPGGLRLATGPSEGRKVREPYHLGEDGAVAFSASSRGTPEVKRAYRFQGGKLIEAPVDFRDALDVNLPVVGRAVLSGKDGIVVWDAAGGTRRIVSAGNPAPGLPGTGLVFSELRETIASGDHVLFGATVRGPGIVKGENDHGIWLSEPDGVKLVAAVGAPIPGGGSSKVTEALPMDVSASGLSVSRLALGGAAAGLWAGRPGSMMPLVGDQAFLLNDGRIITLTGKSGLAVGTIDEQVRFFSAYDSAGGIIDGQVSVSPAGKAAWLARNRDGALSLYAWNGVRTGAVLQAGDLVEIAPGDRRRIATGGILLANSSSSREWRCDWRGHSSINDNGKLLVCLKFDAEPGVRDRSEGVVLVSLTRD